MIEFPEVADFFYSEIQNIQSDTSFSNRKKIIALWSLLNDFINEILKHEKIFFTEYAKLHFVVAKYKISEETKIGIFRLKKYITHLKEQKKQAAQFSTVNYYTKIFYDLIYSITNFATPQVLDILNLPNQNTEPKTQENISNSDKITSNVIYDLKVVISKKISTNTELHLICIDNNNDYIKILIDNSNNNNLEMVKMSWKSATILFSELEIIEEPTSNDNTYDSCKCKTTNYTDGKDHTNNYINIITANYKTTPQTNIIIEPDYLIDVTEVVECFKPNLEAPIIPILNKFIGWSYSDSAFKGNLINSFFDELLENIECSFDAALKNAIMKKPLSMMVYLKKLQEKTQEKKIFDYEILLKIFRTDVYGHFDNLRNIILENYTNTNNFIEPSFISNHYGLQGRFDLMSISTNNSNSNSSSNSASSSNSVISIVELKSGKAPPSTINISTGINKKHNLNLPLWINHYVQIICYNMILSSVINEINFKKTSQYRIGTSAILYSIPGENAPIRSIITNNFVKNEVIIMRNWLVAYLRELSLGNINILASLTSNQINILPSYLQTKISSLTKKLNNLEDIFLKYFQAQVTFITREIFANKIGLFSNNGRQAFASSWLDSFEEKLYKNTIIADLYLNIERSDFNLMHIAFDRRSDTQNDFFRKGDVCIMRVQEFESDDFIKNSDIDILSVSQQILRGRIMYIDDREVVISFRNKLSQNLFISNSVWYVESDYLETTNNYIFNSISSFVFSDFSNKNCILGLEQPCELPISETKKYKNYIDSLDNIPADKKNILYKALSAKNYFLIQGPPGTGKTSYILRYLSQILYNTTSQNILLLAHTNRAVDEICSALLKISKDFNFIRLGNSDSSEYKSHLLVNIPLERLVEKINNTRFFVSTVSTAISNPEIFELKFFDTVIIDEATQILESHIVGILSKCNKFIMIGDEKQLPAITTINTKEIFYDSILENIELKNLQDSLFERLLRLCKKNSWDSFAMLTEQNRMTPEIMQLINKLFYNNNLESGDQLNIIESAPDKIKMNYRKKFINTPLECTSKFNSAEIDIVLDVLNQIEEVFGDKFNEKTVGVISPWRLQCNGIYKRLSDKQKRLVTVDTVERFQGSEREVIIYSTATNSEYLLKLLSETKNIDGIEIDRKLNVAISRAKQTFIMLGNRDLLSTNHTYNQLIEIIEN